MEPRRTGAFDERTQASDPGRINLSHDKLRVLHPEFFSSSRWPWQRRSEQEEKRTRRILDYIAEHIHFADSRAAVVLSVEPALLIAAYTDELDCVVAVGFLNKGPDGYPRNLARRLVQTYGLEEGKRLLTINAYLREESGIASDLKEGPRAFRRWTNVLPIIADFVTEDSGRVLQRKAAIAG
jgi:hypothetical protein